ARELSRGCRGRAGAREVDCAVVNSNSARFIAAAAAQVRAKLQGSLRIENGHESVLAASAGWLLLALGLDRIEQREIGGKRSTSHKGVAAGAGDNCKGAIIAGAAEISGIDQA